MVVSLETQIINLIMVSDNTLDALIVGAGFSGLYVLHQLRKRGFTAKIFEAGSGIGDILVFFFFFTFLCCVGGTWFWNCYPGARTDSMHTVYQYMQDDIWEGFQFPERFASQKQLLAYFQYVEKKLNLSEDIQLNTRVVSAEFSSSRSQWLVKTEDESLTWAHHLVLCTGFAERRYTPPFKGLDNFKGEIHHSSGWPEGEVVLKGKRVAVIGTGATGLA